MSYYQTPQFANPFVTVFLAFISTLRSKIVQFAISVAMDAHGVQPTAWHVLQDMDSMDHQHNVFWLLLDLTWQWLIMLRMQYKKLQFRLLWLVWQLVERFWDQEAGMCHQLLKFKVKMWQVDKLIISSKLEWLIHNYRYCRWIGLWMPILIQMLMLWRIGRW